MTSNFQWKKIKQNFEDKNILQKYLAGYFTFRIK